MKIRQQINDGIKTLTGTGTTGPAARLEAEILMAHALGTSRSFLYAHSDLEVPGPRLARFRQMIQGRARGEPIAYLTGVREFWSLPLKVNEQVLIPRPETELLVEAALECMGHGHSRVADLGTGCGAIALALASERKMAEIHAVDVSGGAVALARENSRSLGIGNVIFKQGSWCQPLVGDFDVIASNPPYVAENDPHLTEGDLRFEPKIALTPGGDGLSAIQEITSEARDLLREGGWLLFEHGLDQGQAVREILTGEGFEEVQSRKDLAFHERVTLGRKA